MKNILGLTKKEIAIFSILYVLCPFITSAQITTTEQFIGTSSPDTAITQKTYGKPIKITGLTTGLSICLSSSGLATTTSCSGGGGSGNVATSSADTANQITTFTSTNATPATIGGSSGLTYDSLSGLLNVGTTSRSARNATISGSVIINTGTAASAFQDLNIGGVGGWNTNESHSINFVFASTLGTANKINSIQSLYDGSFTYLNFRDFNNGGNMTSILMSIRGDGNVGIGTTTQKSLLSVAGGASIGSNYNILAPSDGLIVQGNVGIGTTTPTKKLEVNGNTFLGGNLALLPASTISGAGLSSCSGASSALTWNSGTGLFGCNTISGGSGNVGTSTPDAANQIAVFTSANATPALIGGYSGFTYSNSAGTLNTTAKTNIATTSATALNVQDQYASNVFTVSTASTTGDVLDVASSTGTTLLGVMQSGQYFQGGSTVTHAFGTGAGTSPTLNQLVGTANDFTYNVTTGSSPTGSNATIDTFTLPQACPTATVPVWSDANKNTDALAVISVVYASSTGPSTFALVSGATGLAGATNYVWNFHVGCY